MNELVSQRKISFFFNFSLNDCISVIPKFLQILKAVSQELHRTEI